MSSDSQHPSIQEFKEFVKTHPLLVQEVRSKEKTWQEFYEEWLILGENHQQWLRYRRTAERGEQNIASVGKESMDAEKSSEQTKDITKAILGFLSKYNINDIQQHLSQFSGALQNIQNIIQNFQSQPSDKQERNDFRDPFSFRRH